MSHLNALLITTENLGSLPDEKLRDIVLAGECVGMNLSHGIAAIGNILAVAAANEDDGLSNKAVISIGWLIETLGEMSGRVHDIEQSADWHLSERAKEQPRKRKP
ncbi:hypothetical protein HK44_023625 [Pseudomonas fluorescens HK44]|uniref:Uncharacterized protein n=1 Tax=Pseudomonas fluorescens HK44 TaxID=1042209 RepID=A0A010S560_PSEFL|nr:hypothetical protein [Pseudomonas fluorescens]EXF95729.1 hypothetical protein HK44_023625 [Pseudomonas fluorescens HK44]